MEELKSTHSKKEALNLTLDEATNKDGLFLSFKKQQFPSKLSMDGLPSMHKYDSQFSANAMSQAYRVDVSTCT